MTEKALCLNGGIGDKLYALPSLYVYEGQVGIPKGDEPIYRLVKDKVRPLRDDDSEAFLNIGHHDSEIVDQIAKNLEVEKRLRLRMPVAETTELEKEQFVDGEGFIILALWGSEQRRCWTDGLLLRDLFDLPAKVIFKRDLGLLPMIERAECVISVNTSTIPMAGAFQVPLVAIDSPNRTGYFLDVEHAKKNADSVLEAYERLMSRPRLKCWCGHKNAERLIRNNVYVLRCDDCGTERQDVKISKQGVSEFYEKHYHRGWRDVVEGLIGYERRCELDSELAEMRLAQWGELDVDGNAWLDVGCGNGALVSILRKRGWIAEGLDIDPLPALLQGLNPMSSWEDAGQFDVISYVDCLEHSFVYDELPVAIEHLADAGKIVVEFPVAQEEAKHYRRLQHLWFFDEDTFTKMVTSYGLKVYKMVRPLKGKRSAIIGR